MMLSAVQGEGSWNCTRKTALHQRTSSYILICMILLSLNLGSMRMRDPLVLCAHLVRAIQVVNTFSLLTFNSRFKASALSVLEFQWLLQKFYVEEKETKFVNS